MVEIERQVREVLHNVNWLMEAHGSNAELMKVNGRKVFIRCNGPCSGCKTNCVSMAFKERMPHINLIYCKGKSS